MSKKHLFSVLFLSILGVSLISPSVGAQEGPKPEAVGLRPDAPPYALHGPYWVGTRDVVIGEGTDRLRNARIWYPAVNPEGVEGSATYSFDIKFEPQPEIKAEVFGHALRDAAPDTSGAPYPLVVYSHGFTGESAWYAYLTEHLASYGFVVIAPSHDAERLYVEGEFWRDLPRATVERPKDIPQTLDYAETLTEPGGDMEGMIDMEHVAVAGHSYGGYTALAAAGARYDPVGFRARCDADRAAGDPNVWLCDTLIPFEANIAEWAGLDAVPSDLWPSWGDPRVDAIVPMAGDSYMFDQRGLAEITVPVLAMGGTRDTGTPYEWGTHPAYRYVSSPQKILVGLEEAEHGVFIVGCGDAPYLVELGWGGFCADAVWDIPRAHDLINHFTTAFLLATLKNDAEAAAALSPDAVAFPGITYEATGF